MPPFQTRLEQGAFSTSFEGHLDLGHFPVPPRYREVPPPVPPSRWFSEVPKCPHFPPSAPKCPQVIQTFKTQSPEFPQAPPVLRPEKLPIDAQALAWGEWTLETPRQDKRPVELRRGKTSGPWRSREEEDEVEISFSEAMHSAFFDASQGAGLCLSVCWLFRLPF